MGDKPQCFFGRRRDHVHHACWKAGLGAQLADAQSGKRRALGRLQDDRIPHRQGGCNLDQRNCERDRRRGNQRDHADGIVEVVGSFVGVVRMARIDAQTGLVTLGMADDELEVVEGREDFLRQRLGARFALLA